MPDQRSYAGNVMGEADVSFGMEADDQTRTFVTIRKEMALRVLPPHL